MDVRDDLKNGFSVFSASEPSIELTSTKSPRALNVKSSPSSVVKTTFADKMSEDDPRLTMTLETFDLKETNHV